MMKSFLTSGVLLALLAVAACADRGDKTADTPDEGRSPAATEPAREGQPPAGPARDSEPRESGTPDASRGTAGARTGAPAASRQPAAPRTSAAARSADEPAARPEEPRASATANNAASSRRAPEWRELTIPAGTALPLELETALSSETAQIESPVRARLTQSVVVDGVTVLPAGANVTGEVTKVERAGRVKGRANLAFSFSQVRADNMTARIQTAPLSYVGEASKGEDATKIGAGAVGGAIVGGIIGGGDGAAKGAAIGGAAGTGVVLATRGKEVELASGTNLAATLAAPVTVRVPLR